MAKIFSDLEIGMKIKELRIKAGLTQEKLAEGLDITFQQVQKYEKGTTKVNLLKLQQIAEALQVPVAIFFDDLPCIAPALTDVEIDLVLKFRGLNSENQKAAIFEIMQGLATK